MLYNSNGHSVKFNIKFDGVVVKMPIMADAAANGTIRP